MKPGIFVDALIKNGFSPFMGVPCSIFKHLINYIEDTPNISYYLSSSEGEAMGIAGGFALSGRLPVVLMQSDGYGNAINPLSSLQLLYSLPCLLLISWRGEPNKKDAPQHFIMGHTLEELLSIFNVPYNIIENNPDSLHGAVNLAREYVKQSSLPYAFIVRKGYFDSYKTKCEAKSSKYELRASYLKTLKTLAKKEDVFIGTTGFLGREMQYLFNNKGKFYMMGSMGCASSIGMAIAKEHIHRKVFVLDGDGALLMKMGTFSTIGLYTPENLVHICFDNNQYESTGGQKTASEKVNLSRVAESCGYNSGTKVESLEDFKCIIKNISRIKGPHFIHVIIKSGTIDELPRPEETPEEMKKTFMLFLSK